MKKTLLVILIAAAPLCIFAQLPSYLPTDGLVGWWPFNGNANDESGNGNDGTVNGATLTSDRFGVASKAYDFQNSHIDLGNSPDFSLTPSGFTVSIWVHNYSNVLGGHILGKRMACSTPDFQYQIAAAGLPTGLVWGGATPNSLSVINSGVLILPNQWRHIVGTFDGSIWALYLDGILIEDINSPITENINANLLVGKSGQCSFYDGQLDDLAIYNRALTQEEITALYTGVPTNNNGEGNTAAANVPAAIAYQAVARNAQGQPLSDAAVQVKFTLLADSLTGATEYSESHSLTTNSLGLFTTAFGMGTPLSGTFAGINWAMGSKYLKVELDAGNGFVDMGTQQLLSVPYAIQAKKSTLLENNALPVYSGNAAALAGGLVAGQLYRTATGDLKIVY
jgi:hypothetical protein